MEDATERWSAETDRVLREAGWSPHRRVSTEEWERILKESDGFEAHEKARAFLAEFGGLEFELSGKGVAVERMPFSLNPLEGQWEADIYEDMSEETGTSLYPIGEMARRHLFLGMAEDGSVYRGRDAVDFFADSGDQALDKLISGYR
ncbi:SUKH-3 domain-containing protein [Streptomyces sp. DSM 44915]|uniref:SUKH-3 domain-containing protein n=1 Tax=Streptomyces chisholmiae TaxID=3075540 RepID=A0ABU2K0G3_9ACTN|nr:SUKH-3 domain-containing protein [Streptomyces sp. DSM 44915]MDT0270750.1 SUKH-3 domain-containing protein [Streptomyces sp. DSM 44915]